MLLSGDKPQIHLCVRCSKISSLKGHCLDLRYSKPVKTVVVKRLMEIATQEGLNVPNTNVSIRPVAL